MIYLNLLIIVIIVYIFYKFVKSPLIILGILAVATLLMFPSTRSYMHDMVNDDENVMATADVLYITGTNVVIGSQALFRAYYRNRYNQAIIALEEFNANVNNPDPKGRAVLEQRIENYSDKIEILDHRIGILNSDRIKLIDLINPLASKSDSED